MHEGKVSTSLGLQGLPSMAEIIQLKRDLEVIRYTGGKAHFACISTAESVEIIRNAKAEGLDVTCSVPISNLIFTDSDLEDFDTKYKVCPPLREQKDKEALIEGLNNGIIDMVTTDHNPLNIELKKTEFEHAAFGSIGLESAFGALNQKFGLAQSINLLTKGKKRFNQHKIIIKPQQKAELSLFNPNTEYNFNQKHIFSKSKNSIFLDEKLKGKVYGVINNSKYYVSSTR
jgi:dihydroorotase